MKADEYKGIYKMMNKSFSHRAAIESAGSIICEGYQCNNLWKLGNGMFLKSFLSYLFIQV